MTITASRPAKPHSAPIVATPDAPSTRPTVGTSTPTSGPSGGPASPAATPVAEPKAPPPQGPTSGRHAPIDTRGTGAAGSTSPAAEVAPTPNGRTLRGSMPTGGQNNFEARAWRAAGSNVPDREAEGPASSVAVSLLDPALSLAADILDDLERVRIANENRLRQLTRTETDADGQDRGFGLDESHPDVARLAAMVETLAKVEHDATLNLQRKLRKHPLGAWVKAQKGVGEKQGARLLAAIGDPYVNAAKGTPRTVSALWAYSGLHVLPVGHCPGDAQSSIADRNQPPIGQEGSDARVEPADGDNLPASPDQRDAQRASAGGDQHGDPGQSMSDTHAHAAGVAAKRRKGERANWSGNAKMRAHLVAESCIKQLRQPCHAAAFEGRWLAVHYDDCTCSPYRVVYDARRAHTAVTHPDWTDGHSHNDALRVASKAILRDLWRAARDWHLANGAKS